MTKSCYVGAGRAVIGRELLSGKEGLVAVFDSHTAPIADYYVLAQLLYEYDLSAMGLPEAEGWQSMRDLTSDEWRTLETIYRSMQHTRFI